MLKFSVRSVAIIAIALFLALMSGAHVLSNIAVNESLASIPPANGLKLAEVSEHNFRQALIKNGGEIPEKIDAKILDLAQNAVAQEPLSHIGLRLLALGKESDGDIDSARKLMRIVAGLTKRDQVSNYWLIRDYGALRDTQNLLKYYDYSLRTSRETALQLLPAMVNGLANDEFIEPMADLLLTRPPWSEQFWSQMLTAKPSLPNAVKLRKRLQDGNEKPSQSVDRQLVSQLVNYGLYAEALELYRSLAPNRESGSKIVNQDFDRVSMLPPVDWDLLSDGKFFADIDTGSKQLVVSISPGGSGTVARQLLHLDSHSYDLTVETKGLTSNSIGMDLEFRCADAGGNIRKSEAIGRITLSEGLKIYRVPPRSNCNYVWLNVNISGA
ncbi:MAG: hypothetical protein ABJJ20_12550, partial [Lentilitoribacter sp.]